VSPGPVRRELVDAALPKVAAAERRHVEIPVGGREDGRRRILSGVPEFVQNLEGLRGGARQAEPGRGDDGQHPCAARRHVDLHESGKADQGANQSITSKGPGGSDRGPASQESLTGRLRSAVGSAQPDPWKTIGGLMRRRLAAAAVVWCGL